MTSGEKFVLWFKVVSFFFISIAYADLTPEQRVWEIQYKYHTSKSTSDFEALRSETYEFLKLYKIEGIHLGKSVKKLDLASVFADFTPEDSARVLSALFSVLPDLCPRLEELSLNRNYLRKLPPEIGYLTGLKKLDLTGNELASLPTTIERLVNLTELNLTINHLTTLPHEIKSLKSLTTLLLFGNPVEVLPSEIERLKVNHISIPPDSKLLVRKTDEPKKVIDLESCLKSSTDLKFKTSQFLKSKVKTSEEWKEKVKKLAPEMQEMILNPEYKWKFVSSCMPRHIIVDRRMWDQISVLLQFGQECMDIEDCSEYSTSELEKLLQLAKEGYDLVEAP